MCAFRSSFSDEVATQDVSFEENLETSLRHDRRDRTILELDDPEPTRPPGDESRMLPLPVRPTMPPAPVRIERYALERLLGSGAFGRVYEARDTKLGRSVAVKVLHPEHAQHHEIRQRFIQEAFVTASIAHPGIVTVFDAGELDGHTAFMAMELLSGESLYRRVSRDGRMASATVRELGRQIASTLHAAHRAGVIHRDLKPENIFLVPDPAAASGERIKVLDFGLAKPTRATIKTAAATVFGTPAYMSPEQCESTRNLDHRSDIYALGCILFHLAAGHAPFDGTLRELLTQHRTKPAPRLRSVVPDVDPELDELVASMLAKSPDDRPQTMHAVVQALASKPEPVAAPAVAEDAPKSTSRKLGLALLAVAGLLAFCLSCGAV